MGKSAHLVLPLFTLLSMGMSLSTETTKTFFDENHLSTKPFFDENHLSEVVQLTTTEGSVATVNATVVGNISDLLRTRCGTWDDEVQSKVDTCSFWMEGVILTITGTIGLIGNVLSIVILSKPDMYNSFNQLLIGLSTMDSIFIVLAILDYSFARAFKWSSQIFVYSFPFIIYPLNNISFCGSIFTTVALAYERYIAVCRPLHYRDVTARYTVRRRTLSYTIPVLLVSLALSVPKFLETRFVWTRNSNLTEDENNNTSNETNDEWVVSLGVSDLRSDPDYIRFYINWTRLVTTGVAPMVALVYFNSNIFRGIQMTHERTKKRNKQRASEMNLAAILLCIVILFLICHFPRILLNVHEFFMLDDMILCGEKGIEFTPPVWFLCFTSFNHSLLIVNASCNFLIYCSVGAKFKTTISKFFARWGCCPPPMTSSPTTIACGGTRDSPLPMIVLAKQSDAGSAMSSMVHENNVDVIIVEVNPSRSLSTKNSRVDKNDVVDDVKNNVDNDEKLVMEDRECSTQHDSLESISVLRDGEPIENGTIPVRQSE